MQSLCAPGRLAPTSHLLNGTLGFMDPKYRGVGLDPGISPEFLSDPGDGRVARLAEEPGGQGTKRRSRIRDRQVIENHSPPPRAGQDLQSLLDSGSAETTNSSSMKTRKNAGVLDRLPPADEKSRSQRRMTKRDVSAAGAGGHICANCRQSWATT